MKFWLLLVPQVYFDLPYCQEIVVCFRKSRVSLLMNSLNLSKYCILPEYQLVAEAKDKQILLKPAFLFQRGKFYIISN